MANFRAQLQGTGKGIGSDKRKIIARNYIVKCLGETGIEASACARK